MPPLLDATAPSPRTGELVPQYPWVTGGGRHRFLPWWDPDQPVTPEIRRGLRKMIADDAVKPALLTKLFSVSSLDWQFQPADPADPRSRLVSDFCLYTAQHMDGGTRALTEEVLFPGLVDGLSVCEIVAREEPEPHGRWAGKELLRCLKAKEHAWPEEDRYGNVTGIYAQTETGWATLPPERFVVFKYLPLFGRPHSDLQAAYRLYVARDALMKLWLVGIERWGQPFAEGTYPPGDDQSKSELVASLGGLKSRSWVVHPDGTAVKFVDSAFQGQAAHEACWQKLTEGIYLSINGAFLTSLTSGTQHLSQRGDSGVQKGTFELFVWHLASVIADCTNAKVWPLVTSRNFVGAAPPRATLGGVNDADLKVSADLDDVLLNKLQLPLSRKGLGAFYGRQLAETPEDALTPAKPPGPPPPPPQAGGSATPFAEPDTAVADLHALGPLLTVREVAGRLRLSPGTVRRLCDGGQLEHRRPGGRYRVTERGLAQYLSVEGPTRPFGEPGAGGQFAPGGGRVPGRGDVEGGGEPPSPPVGGNRHPHTGRLADGRVVHFVPHPNQRPDETMIMVDPRKWDEGWQKDSMYLPPEGQGGGGEVKGRREDFKRFLGTGLPVQASRGGLGPDGLPYFEDGRHRFAVLRDLGADRVAVTVSKKQAKKILKKYGAG